MHQIPQQKILSLKPKAAITTEVKDDLGLEWNCVLQKLQSVLVFVTALNVFVIVSPECWVYRKG